MGSTWAAFGTDVGWKRMHLWGMLIIMMGNEVTRNPGSRGMDSSLVAPAAPGDSQMYASPQQDEAAHYHVLFCCKETREKRWRQKSRFVSRSLGDDAGCEPWP